MEGHTPAGTQARVIAAIGKLADYAQDHGLDAIHQSLARALEAVHGFGTDEESGLKDLEETMWFASMLDILIAVCRRHGWREVLDHLLEAKMAWDERDDPHPAGNILAFRTRQK